ncbi:MAG: aminoglycoside phosphotransferase family protein [Candidatus Micrarchaeota archaeon]
MGKKYFETDNFKVNALNEGKIYYAFKLSTANKAYVIRISGKLKRYKWGDLRAEKWAYEHIKNILPVPKFFDVGEMYKRSYSIASFINGTIPSPNDTNIAVLAGRILKKLHNIKFPKYGDIDILNDKGVFDSWQEFLTKQINDYLNFIPKNTIQTKYLDLLMQIPEEANFKLKGSLLHGDFQRRNLLKVANRISGVIDFDRCLIGDPFFDFAPLLYHSEQTWSTNVIKGYFSTFSPPKYFYRKVYLYVAIRALNVLSLINVEKNFIADNVLKDLYRYIDLGFGL